MRCCAQGTNHVNFKRCIPSLAALMVTLSLAAPAFAAPASPAEAYGKLLDAQEKQFVALAEAMPADKYSFSPNNGSFIGVRTFGQQLTHVAEAQYFFFGPFGMKPGFDVKSLDKLSNKEAIIKAVKDSFAFAKKATATMTAENAFEPVKEVDGADTRATIVAFDMAHTNDHYGQMVVYLRMNGIVPPGSK
jgi:uncharacterized damage-inducible protein DinB